ncbi:hypothetical protein SprV_0301269300 [Sparganum proliferum]
MRTSRRFSRLFPPPSLPPSLPLLLLFFFFFFFFLLFFLFFFFLSPSLPPSLPLILILLHRQFHIPDNSDEMLFLLRLISLDDDDTIRIRTPKFRFVAPEDKRLLLSQDHSTY